MASTLLLDTLAWDLVLDIAGNIALATEPYSQAQDAASAIRLFQGELWFDTTQGLPYWASILGESPPLQLVKDAIIAAAKTVPGVVSAQCFFTSFKDRQLAGQVQLTNSNGVVSVVVI